MSPAEERTTREATISRRAVTLGLVLAVTGCAGVGYEAECEQAGIAKGSPEMARCIEAKQAAAKKQRRRARALRPPRHQGSGG